jgi:hypothetical protein
MSSANVREMKTAIRTRVTGPLAVDQQGCTEVASAWHSSSFFALSIAREGL